MAILHAYLARLIVLGETPNCRTLEPTALCLTHPDFPCRCGVRFCLRPHPNSTPMDAVAALRCLGLDEFAFEFRKAAQDGHISRPAVVVVSVHSPRGIGLTLWSVMAFRKQQQINGGLC
jgi:hypothetical protein